ncbi:MAG: NAD(P)H-hydrate dehydratase [Verrucomicrobia bacterium]|nr:NAD(P)H-hydrate dehydratase [Verrucomicrobiota bacterium]
MILTAQQMKAAEELAFRNGATPEGLMEIAGEGIARCIGQFFPYPGTAVLYCGKGHNGGDGLVSARHLLNQGWKILIRLAAPESEMSELSRLHLLALHGAELIDSIPQIRGPLLLLDGLLGIGASGAPRSSFQELIHEMNALRRKSGGYTVAVDLPSGLDATTGEIPGGCVQADLTVTIGAVKSGLVADAATAVVGRIALIELPGVPIEGGDPASISTALALRSLLPIRNYDSYKGTYGHIGILAGSSGFLGAAQLCSAAALHAGGGLVTLYALPECHDLLASTCIPEVMVQRIASYNEIPTEKLDVLALGPGLGAEHHEELRGLVRDSRIPCVVDADALNAVAFNPSLLSQCAGPRLLTPHPGEMERLAPRDGRTRRNWATDFIESYPVTLLLKGSRTIIAEKGNSPVFNSTGNPGMGSGGMGDVLTGVCAALIGSGQSCREAAMLGAWLCGRAAELAIFNGSDAQESLSATSVISYLGEACKSLRNGDY